MYLDDHMSCSCILLTKCSMFNSSAVFLAGSITCITSAWIVAALFCPEEMVRWPDVRLRIEFLLKGDPGSDYRVDELRTVRVAVRLDPEPQEAAAGGLDLLQFTCDMTDD